VPLPAINISLPMLKYAPHLPCLLLLTLVAPIHLSVFRSNAINLTSTTHDFNDHVFLSHEPPTLI
jgi:hypothetical protein